MAYHVVSADGKPCGHRHKRVESAMDRCLAQHNGVRHGEKVGRVVSIADCDSGDIVGLYQATWVESIRRLPDGVEISTGGYSVMLPVIEGA